MAQGSITEGEQDAVLRTVVLEIMLCSSIDIDAVVLLEGDTLVGQKYQHLTVEDIDALIIGMTDDPLGAIAARRDGINNAPHCAVIPFR